MSESILSEEDEDDEENICDSEDEIERDYNLSKEYNPKLYWEYIKSKFLEQFGCLPPNDLCNPEDYIIKAHFQK